MSSLSTDWKAAKSKFETDTGMKKPTESAKVGLGKLSISYRKSTNIESALETLDKLFPNDLQVPVGSKKEKTIGGAIDDLDKAASAYGELLTKTIKEQKDQFGKGTDSLYRDLKILRASLESNVSAAKRDLAKLVAARDIAESGVTSGMKVTIQTLKTLKESLEAAVKASTVRAQEILKNPTPATFNSHFESGKAAREVTQALNNIAKFTMPDDTNPHARSRALEAMKDESVYKAVEDLYHRVEGIKDMVRPMVKETGNSPSTASITKMANHPEFFDDTASKEDVIAGTKHFLMQLKSAMAVSAGFR